tara:strand:- start:60 stop:617 length:558 start_codon:yes stop_codon:yes gene_type:complete
MNSKNLTIEGIYLFKPKRFEDKRGMFFETFNESRLNFEGIKVKFKQDNFSRSKKNVLRGLHFCKLRPQAQLVTILKGKILDVLVDLRFNSKTFGNWISFELSDDSTSQIYMEKGFAHGFYVISDYVDMHYKVSEIYDPKDDHGIIWNDPDLDIDWQCDDPILSEKDKGLPPFKDIKLFKDINIYN